MKSIDKDLLDSIKSDSSLPASRDIAVEQLQDSDTKQRLVNQETKGNNGMTELDVSCDVVVDEISPNSYELSADGLTLLKWKNFKIKNLDMNLDARLREVKIIGEGAFRGRSNLTYIDIPSSVTSITISSSVTSIGRFAFSDCRSLTSITIPSSVRSIEKSAFSGCRSLTHIDIPSSVTSIEE